MGGTVIEITLDDVLIHIHFFGDSSTLSKVPLFLLPYVGNSEDLMDGQHMRIDPVIASGEMLPHVVVVVHMNNWNDDLSPWPAAAIRKNETAFTGGAPTTLEWMLSRLIPYIEMFVPSVQGGVCGLFGYSMAGLFAIWAIGQTDRFTVCASCSGSLWYEGFFDYLQEHQPLVPCYIYLSLGEREEYVKNESFARVGDATRRTADFLAISPMCRDVKLVWHPGGHLGAVGARLAEAHFWMKKICENLPSY